MIVHLLIEFVFSWSWIVQQKCCFLLFWKPKFDLKSNNHGSDIQTMGGSPHFKLFHRFRFSHFCVRFVSRMMTKNHTFLCLICRNTGTDGRNNNIFGVYQTLTWHWERYFTQRNKSKRYSLKIYQSFTRPWLVWISAARLCVSPAPALTISVIGHLLIGDDYCCFCLCLAVR